jgi:GDPmannose 4,6-dehydratase
MYCNSTNKAAVLFLEKNSNSFQIITFKTEEKDTNHLNKQKDYLISTFKSYLDDNYSDLLGRFKLKDEKNIGWITIEDWSNTLSEYLESRNYKIEPRILIELKDYLLPCDEELNLAKYSEMFGNNGTVNYITEETPFYPRSPYGVGKLYAHCITRNYRESYNMFACSGILFNHESPRRGPTFVTRKITIGLGKILKGEEEFISLGNIYAKRDWGHAKDYVNGMWLMLQQDKAEDFILSSCETYSVKDFIEKSFSLKGFNIKWRGEGVNEEGYDENSGKVLIKISEKYFRPAEIDVLLGDCTNAKQKLGWSPQYTFDDLVKEMVEMDCS